MTREAASHWTNPHLPLKGQETLRLWHGPIRDLVVKYASADATILDLGCGHGQLGAIIQSSLPAASISVADAYQGCIDSARQRIPSLRQAYLIDETTFDVSALIPDRFDIVVMSHVLEHLLSPVTALRDVMGLVAPGGYLIVAVPNASRPEVIIHSAFRRNAANSGHVVAWDRAHWMNFLERILKLNVVEYGADPVVPFPGGLGRFVARYAGMQLAKAFPWLTSSNIAVIRKE